MDRRTSISTRATTQAGRFGGFLVQTPEPFTLALTAIALVVVLRQPAAVGNGEAEHPELL
jgi:hypothetical protein